MDCWHTIPIRGWFGVFRQALVMPCVRFGASLVEDVHGLGRIFDAGKRAVRTRKKRPESERYARSHFVLLPSQELNNGPDLFETRFALPQRRPLAFQTFTYLCRAVSELVRNAIIERALFQPDLTGLDRFDQIG
jgi:hypothetical protein